MTEDKVAVNNVIHSIVEDVAEKHLDVLSNRARTDTEHSYTHFFFQLIVPLSLHMN